MSEKFVTISLIRSPLHRTPGHRATLRALGLRRLGIKRTHRVTPVIQGMLNQVGYMLKIEEAKK
jgi:large subunit ribosomal protein L30